ncbi:MULTISPECIES: hypothetical protein [Achromobacter]|uniref:Peptidase n=1 Tax=Achromobacter spanius TaxID=217203 RepID=A0ABY8GUP5_9BURK|nr:MULTISPECIES: hypothetical protein [Achromobacter]WAI82285.1 hypothetical protein N8Z00_22535 [Achromobacter spanius]WEX92373.1 hypothetical protein N3Z32_17145 [Achromobacter sp. SS2-2022]WFP08477.1 hypothetical protein P8T11_00990 [Achromobacter spanius]
MRNPFLLAAVLMMSGCAVSPTQYVPREVPPLDRRLAEPCPPIPDPPQNPDSYDDWQVWAQGQVLVLWGLCASRHRETVRAWPK